MGTVTWPGIKSTSYPPHISATSLLISLVTDVVTIITKIVGSGRGEKRKRWFIWRRRRRVEFWRRDLEGVGERGTTPLELWALTYATPTPVLGETLSRNSPQGSPG